MEKLAAPAEVFAALQRAFLCLADPAVGGAGLGGSGGTGAAAAALGRSAEGDRLTIARAMAAVYSAHADAIGETLWPSRLTTCSTVIKTCRHLAKTLVVDQTTIEVVQLTITYAIRVSNRCRSFSTQDFEQAGGNCSYTPLTHTVDQAMGTRLQPNAWS